MFGPVFLLFSLFLSIWPISMFISLFSDKGEYDDDNIAVVLLNSLPFILVIVGVNSIVAYQQYFMNLIAAAKTFFLKIDPGSSQGQLLISSLGLVLFFLIIGIYSAIKLFNDWRFSRWAELHGFRLISRRRLWRFPGALFKSRYQALHALQLEDRDGVIHNVEALVGSYWGNNPNKFEIFWEAPESAKAKLSSMHLGIA